jgi:glycosyltransferase involved in cell wall biosynthesis
MFRERSSVAILLAAFNGERFLEAQIRSILDQSWPFWKLYIRDDGSNDCTPAIASRFAHEHPDRIFFVPSDQIRLGADGNFSYLLEHVESDYFMFCDQDDVWLPSKVERSLQCMWDLETEARASCPLLVHTDARVVDAELRELSPSAWKYGYHRPEFSQRLNRLLVQNMVSGCTVLINSALREFAAPIPKGVVQYDWWLALVSICFGKIGYLSEPTLLYRQHGGNSVGATRWNAGYVVGKAVRFFDRQALVSSWAASRHQAALLLDRYAHRLSTDRRQTIQAYAALGDQGFLSKRKTLLKYGFLKTGVIRNLGLFLRI